METNVSLNVPDREPDETDITDKQAAYIRQLLSGLGGSDVKIDYRALGKWQASSLIDQLIELRDRGADVITSQIPATRKMTPILGAGILLVPYIFAWATLRSGYTRLDGVGIRHGLHRVTVNLHYKQRRRTRQVPDALRKALAAPEPSEES